MANAFWSDPHLPERRTDRLCEENVVWGGANMGNETRRGDE